jgi:hypothetical protein
VGDYVCVEAFQSHRVGLKPSSAVALGYQTLRGYAYRCMSSKGASFELQTLYLKLEGTSPLANHDFLRSVRSKTERARCQEQRNKRSGAGRWPPAGVCLSLYNPTTLH